MAIVIAGIADAGERQITHDVQSNHELDNNDNFSPDDRFLVFDTRTVEGGISASKMVAKVEIDTGEVTSLYKTKEPTAFGPGAGAASYSHVRDEVIFIHGPFHSTGPENQYEQYRRVGVVAAGDGSGEFHLADARCLEGPYAAGALRGGTHRHEFSGDGNWVGFTYNDAVMIAYGKKIGQDFNLRTIGVTQLGQPLTVVESEQFPNTVDGFSALVVVVVPNPKPGSDEISRAAGDSWVGRDGYLRASGTRQMARAFIGTTRDADGNEVDELFLVDIPTDITRPGSLGPLEGTATTFPMPPAGAAQRRLTDSTRRKNPGCMGIVRTSHDGSTIAFLMKDNQGDWQVYLTTPQGAKPKQATFVEGGVDTGVRWHPDGKAIVNVAGSRILVTTVESGPNFGKSRILCDCASEPFALVWSHDGKTIAYNRRIRVGGRESTQIFALDYPGVANRN
ncbi:MAG: DUF3748 domain-containing protein [Planctomycetes bacterium]|nr:DUF3748 domain-containing protein [Planctomycetota bacterium]